MAYNYSNVYTFRVVDTDDQGTDQTWFAGPHYAAQADRTVIQSKSAARNATMLRSRQSRVERLVSDDKCLSVNRDRHIEGSQY